MITEIGDGGAASWNDGFTNSKKSIRFESFQDHRRCGVTHSGIRFCGKSIYFPLTKRSPLDECSFFELAKEINGRDGRFQARGARALVILHEHHLREFLVVWRQFKTSGLELPATTDPSHSSAENLLCHVLGAARGYMTWICEELDLPDPGIRRAPDEAQIEAKADAYL